MDIKRHLAVYHIVTKMEYQATEQLELFNQLYSIRIKGLYLRLLRRLVHAAVL